MRTSNKSDDSHKLIHQFLVKTDKNMKDAIEAFCLKHINDTGNIITRSEAVRILLKKALEQNLRQE
jgi:hypothetical protein